MVDKDEIKSRKSFLQKLRSDTAGNTMAMAAAALFPIAGMIGGGVDIGRAYMAKARLQQACDAGALAGRRAMSGATMSESDKAEALKFFNFNFQDGVFGTNSFQKVDGIDNPRFIDGPGDRTVQGFAETTINTSIMRIFGFEEMSLKVSCTSRLDIGNVDVMMVMDVTGSMDWKPNGSSTYNESEKRITGLKNAVKEFYDILGPGGGTSGSQVRYGFMPYNAMINVGETLYDEDPSWLVGGTGVAEEDEWHYQTRRAHWKIYSEYLRDVVGVNTDSSYSACQNEFSETRNGYYYEYSSGEYNWYTKKCTRDGKEYDAPPTKVEEWEPNAVFDFWEYDQFPHDVSTYVASIKSSNPKVLRPTLYNNPNDPTDGPSDRWDGCIEERDTDSSIEPTTNAIPANAYDLDIDLIPSSKATRWRPYWKGVEYRRSGSQVSSSDCPAPGRRLASYPTYDSSGTDSDGNVITGNLKSYIDGLNPAGNTNHTIGMIWGARFLSGSGLFAAENSKTKNGFNISRHLVFMTDGDLNVFPNRYNVYGYNELDGRLGPTWLGQNDYEKRQAQRFQLMCSAAKAKGITVWTIQFTASSTVGTNLLNCASSPKHAAAATSNEALKSAFGNIAKTIGGLRLSK
ncbi:TadE/TadG family type IV pilus assembly protein [Parasphingorhabdus sp.]|uniref:TadE/TadG family type IV pilus assembly protein n=1 Tax=Parasphingorhabdus sp. TaxID=2709688 RepID=UPI002F95DE01